MKTQTRPKSGIITVPIITPQGTRLISTGTTDKAEARQIIKAANIAGIQALAKTGHITQELIRKLTVGGSLTLEDAIPQWADVTRVTARSDSTAENSITFVNAWARGSGGRHSLLKKRLSEIEAKHISNWINADDGIKWGSRRIRLYAVRSFFKFCIIRQFLSYDPTNEVSIKVNLLSHEQKEPRKKLCFTDDEIKRITDHLYNRLMNLMVEVDPKNPNISLDKKIRLTRFWYCAVIIGHYAGLRLGDICSLEWASLNTPRKLIVWTDKRDTRVELPVDDNLFKGISAIPTNSTRFCFPEQDAAIRDKKKRSKFSVYFSRILERVGISGHSFHDLRHTFSVDCKKRGMPVPHISKALGHGSEESTGVYLDH